MKEREVLSLWELEKELMSMQVSCGIIILIGYFLVPCLWARVISITLYVMFSLIIPLTCDFPWHEVDKNGRPIE